MTHWVLLVFLYNSSVTSLPERYATEDACKESAVVAYNSARKVKEGAHFRCIEVMKP